ncbi:MAG: hypothetical protein K8H89_07950 [Flavobacteriales bacterium]|jgi:hypothetical protein|nr:hypothetical protein [Flavobacteriales bacterium]MCB0757502.1 hypothetical protein [Flavobacteriales bacterium]
MRSAVDISKNWKHVLIACLISPAVEAQVDGFNKGAGNMDVVTSFSYQKGLDYYLADGNAGIERNQQAVTLFAARGITGELDLQLSVPFIWNSTEADFQDASAFLKWLPVNTGIGKGRLALGPALGYSLPLTDYQTEGVNAIGQQATGVIPMGVVQYTWDNGWFASLVGGEVFASDPTPDALIGTLRFGHFNSTHFWEIYAQGQKADGGKNYRGTGDLAPTSFKELGVDFLKVGGKYYKLVCPRIGIVAEANYVLSGRNVDQAVMGALSAVIHFGK